MPELTVEQRVANGVEWLDVNKPGWEPTIDVGRLNLAAPCLCVLGQLFGDYWRSPLAARNHSAQIRAANLGFNAYPPPPVDDWDDFYDRMSFTDYEALNGEWIRVISARREAATHG